MCHFRTNCVVIRNFKGTSKIERADDQSRGVVHVHLWFIQVGLKRSREGTLQNI